MGAEGRWGGAGRGEESESAAAGGIAGPGGLGCPGGLSATVPPASLPPSGLCGTAAASANFRLARTWEHLGAN